MRVRVEGGDDLVVRLPRRPHAAEHVEDEVELLRALSVRSLPSGVRTPTVRHLGQAHEVFPHRWAVLEWRDGTDGWTARDDLGGVLDSIALEVADAVLGIGALEGMPAPQRVPGGRGGPIEPLVRRIHWWVDSPQWNAAALIDVPAVRRLAAEALELAPEPVTNRFVHGDLIPGNLLIDRGHVSAIIDWGSAGYADPAQDLAPAWAVFEGRSRDAFREAVGADEAAWVRGRTFELEHAVGGVVYYVPRRHPLGDVMARTLERILRG